MKGDVCKQGERETEKEIGRNSQGETHRDIEIERYKERERHIHREYPHLFLMLMFKTRLC